MMYKVLESAAARRDLDGAVSYLVDTLKAPSAGIRLLDEYERAIGMLETEPLAFPLVRDDLLAFSGYRWVAAASYIAFFTVDEASKTVNIERIAHQSRNWIQLLR